MKKILVASVLGTMLMFSMGTQAAKADWRPNHHVNHAPVRPVYHGNHNYSHNYVRPYRSYAYAAPVYPAYRTPAYGSGVYVNTPGFGFSYCR